MRATRAKLDAFTLRAFGPDHFRTAMTRYLDADWAIELGWPEASLETLAATAEHVAATARTRAEQMQAGWVLAHLADKTSTQGNQNAAMAIVARTRALLDTHADLETELLRSGEAYLVIATLSLRNGRLEDALALGDRAIEIYEAHGGSNDVMIPYVLGIKGQAFGQQGNYPANEAALRRSLAIIDRQPGSDPILKVRVPIEYALFLSATGRYDLALPMIERGVDAGKALSPTFPVLQGTALVAGRTYLGAGKPEGARPHLDRGLQLIRALGKPSRTEALILIEHSKVERLAGHLERAEADARDALAILDRVAAKTDVAKGNAGVALADIDVARGDLPAALDRYERSFVELATAGPDARSFAIARMRALGLAVQSGAMDGRRWFVGRQGSESLIRDITRAGATGGGDGFPIADVRHLFDDAVAAGWARAQQVEMSPRARSMTLPPAGGRQPPVP